jgi:cytochrome c-type biogenesis protein CcmE
MADLGAEVLQRAMEVLGRFRDALRFAQSPLPEAFVASWATIGLLAAPFLARHRSRLRLALRIGATVVALSVAGGLLVEVVKTSVVSYKHVDEVLANRDAFEGRRLYVHGCVAPGSIEQQRGTQRYRFSLGIGERNGGALLTSGVLRVAYEGLVPDIFRDGSEVVVKGELRPDGTLVATPDGLMVKCPGKYSIAGLDPPPPPPFPL